MSDRDKPVEWLKQYIGISEGSTQHKKILSTFNSVYTGYTMKTSDAWCAAATSAAFIGSGLKSIFPCIECSCSRMITLAQKAGIWYEDDSYTPSTGDVILYDWQDSGSGDNAGNPDHVGIVVSVSGSTIKVIEGNKSNTVGYRNISVNGKYIRGYVLPKFSDSGSSSSSTTTKTDKTVDELAQEVLNGQWGNGEDRRNALEAAGYDYDAVQDRVNELANSSSSTTVLKSIDEIAQEVIDAKWGNGDERKEKLEAAGYDYSEVQAKVNELLSASNTVTKTVDELAQEVLNGDWGTGEARKNALTEAGYDYSAVQSKVNELVQDNELTQVAKDVIAGKYGNGITRKLKLKAAGYNYSKVQAKVNELLS